ncbi:jg17772 [Pararge aegeria aegeria]|uniref:Jg17772 protein n=1 Tax=Pararge aegeria aegeria TaxID=348720 RepID=A0A8S4R8Z8_9NEOP|nr:jg17772 [Pararge aegeria aegeria]
MDTEGHSTRSDAATERGVSLAGREIGIVFLHSAETGGQLSEDNTDTGFVTVKAGLAFAGGFGCGTMESTCISVLSFKTFCFTTQDRF